MNQLHIHIFSPGLPPVSLSHPSRSSQSTELSSLYHIAASYQLSVLHMVVCMSLYISQSQSSNSFHLHFPLDPVYMSILYVCISIPARQVGSFVLLSHKKEWNWVIFRDMNGPRVFHTDSLLMHFQTPSFPVGLSSWEDTQRMMVSGWTTDLSFAVLLSVLQVVLIVFTPPLSSLNSSHPQLSLLQVLVIYLCDIAIYNRKYVFGLCPCSWLRALKTLVFPKR